MYTFSIAAPVVCDGKVRRTRPIGMRTGSKESREIVEWLGRAAERVRLRAVGMGSLHWQEGL